MTMKTGTSTSATTTNTVAVITCTVKPTQIACPITTTCIQLDSLYIDSETANVSYVDRAICGNGNGKEWEND